MKMNFLLALCLLGVVTAQGQSLYINELVASNNQDQMDEFFEFDDWIEIYNTGGITNLAGYYLSDDPLLLTKYAIPNDPALTTILPNGYLIFWCDNDNATQGTSHTNFTLKSGGETVFLTAPDGTTIIDSISYPQMATDISYGRTCDGCATWQYFNNTTWNAMNQEVINPNGELLFINEIQTTNTQTIHDLAFDYEPWVEIYNPNGFQVNLAGYQIQNASGTYTIPSNNPTQSIIPAGGFRVVWLDNEPLEGALHLNLTMSPQGNVKLMAPNGTTIDQVNYAVINANQSWGRSSDGGGSWITFNAPTPTASNSLFIIPGQAVKVNEVMAKNLTTLMDNFGEYEDWVEIYNPLGTAVNLSGYYFSDNPEIRNKWQIPGTFPDSVTVPANGWRLFYCDADLNQGVLHNNFSLSNGGEYVGLFGPDGFSLVDEVQWTFMGADTTYGRLYDGYAEWVQFTTAATVTPEASNGTAPIGVEEAEAKGFQVFPNPSVEAIQFTQPTSGRIYDAKGQLVMVLKNTQHLDVQAWAMGSYMIVREDGRAVRWVKQ